MRKLLLLIPVLVTAFTVNATSTRITTDTYGSDNIRKALYYATTDTIVVADGTYEESTSNYLDLNKNIVLMAEGSNAVIQTRVPVIINGGVRAIIKGIKFDATYLTDYTHLIYASDASDNNRLYLDGCELYNFAPVSSLIYCASDKKMDSCIVNNCKFHDNNRSCLFFENADMVGVVVTNSTFYNIANPSTSYSAGIIDPRGTSTSLLVDHCTFYNCPAKNSDYGAVKVLNSTNAIVSNSIFMMPESFSGSRAIHMIAGNVVRNCLVYNYTASTNGIHYNVTPTDCLFANPLFTDAANNDFSFPANWTTGNISPARGAATDGSDLGDPRWYTEETLPSTDFASAYDLMPVKALLSGNIALDEAKIKYSGSGTPGTAKWKLHIEKACALSVLVDRTVGNSSGCQLALTAYDADDNVVDAVAATSASYSEADITLPGSIYIPEAGDYTLILTNSTNNSGAILEKITLSYMGGAVQAISTSANTTLPIDEAWFAGCTRDADGITFTGHTTDWIKWNISTTETKFYDLTLNINASNAHGLTVAIYEDENAVPVASVTEGSYISTTGTLSLELGRISLSGGKNYVAKITNAPSGSVPEVTNLTFAPVVATTTSLPNTLDFVNAVLSERAHLTGGNLYFAPIGDTNPVGDWARWSVATNHNGLFLFTMGVNSDNAQSYKISILDDGDNVVDFCDLKTNSGVQTLKHCFQLAIGNYSVKVENTYAWSHGYLTSLVVSEPNDAVTINESATTNESWAAKVNDGNSYNVQIIRTIKAGMYNTFCLPFEVSSNMCKAIFGLDVELRTLDEAIVEDNVLTLNFKNASDIYPGTPVLIKTSRDIVNPVFTDVQFTTAAPSATTKTHADYEGTFVKSSLDADPNILFLGANNKLYFPTASVEILGMRGWFEIHGSGGSAPAVYSARIITPNNIPTEIEIVRPEPTTKSQKLLMNGQIYIMYNGTMYNAQGQIVK